MEKSDTKSIHTATTEKPVARVEFYRNTSTIDKTKIISLNVTALTKEEASELFTEKLEELGLTKLPE